MRTLGVAALCAVACLQTALGARLSLQDQPPRFRVEANFVRVDVYPTLDGVPVRDLDKADFEVYEDGRQQAIETFEHVDVAAPDPGATARDPTSTREARERLENGRGRLFVIFLDPYFLDIQASHDVRLPLVRFLTRLLGPDDVFAIMTPDMSASDLSFGHGTTTIEGYLSRHWNWGKRDDLIPTDLVEQNYQTCYGNSPVAGEMISRRHEKRTLDALDDTTRFLGGVREGRKAVVVFTGGWMLFRPSDSLLNQGRKPLIDHPNLPGESRPIIDTLTNEDTNYSVRNCEKDRIALASLDDWQTFHDIIDRANRANVTFYPVNAMGLEGFDRPIDAPDPTEGELQAVGPRAHRGEDPFFPNGNPLVVNDAMIAQRTENLESLAENTDGLAVVNTNDLIRGLTRIVQDMSSYYLLGYYSSNPKLDGKYRKITVKVTRPSVDVRARRGYRAATETEVVEAQASAERLESEGPPAGVQAALNALVPLRPEMSLRTAASYLGAETGAANGAHLWVTAQLGPAARPADWSAGGTVEVAVTAGDGAPITREEAAFAPGQRAVEVDLGELPVSTSSLTIRTYARAGGGGLPLSDTIRIAELTPSGRPLLSYKGPTTGNQYVPAAAAVFHRTSRLRLKWPVGAPVSEATATLLDRAGTATAVSVKASVVSRDGVAWVTSEFPLAVLAPADYIIRLRATDGTTTREVWVAVQVEQ